MDEPVVMTFYLSGLDDDDYGPNATARFGNQDGGIHIPRKTWLEQGRPVAIEVPIPKGTA